MLVWTIFYIFLACGAYYYKYSTHGVTWTSNHVIPDSIIQKEHKSKTDQDAARGSSSLNSFIGDFRFLHYQRPVKEPKC